MEVLQFTVLPPPFPLPHLQVPQEAGADVLSVSQPGRDERRGGPALQLTAHAQEADPECRLCGESWSLHFPTPDPNFCFITLMHLKILF